MKLSDIEIQVLILTCNDIPAKQIGVDMCKSKRTIDGYRQSLYKKTNTNGIAGLVKYALRNNIIEL